MAHDTVAAMPSRFRIIDADGHVMEPVGMWQRYIDPRFRDRAPRVERVAGGSVRILVDGHVCPRSDVVTVPMQQAFSVRTRELLGEYRDADYSAAAQVK